MRIASLLPSATEIVCAVGARSELVGISHECDFPPGVGTLPVLTRPRRQLARGSAAIDRDVRELVEQSLSVYEVLLDALRDARPDVIVTQALCDVCAVSVDDVQQALARLGREDVRLVSLEPTRLAAVWEDVRQVGHAIGRAEQAEHVAADLEARCARLGERTAVEAGARPRVLSIEWLDPVMAGGTWMPELIDLAGGTPLVTRPGQHAVVLSHAQLEALDPDLVLVKPCGYGLARTTRELPLLRDALPWERWRAAAAGRVFVADGAAYFNRPGPRLVESLEILAACLAPERHDDLVALHEPVVRRVLPDLSLAPLR